MLKNISITDLLSGKLKEPQIRQRLLELTPDKLDTESLKMLIEETRLFCSPDFAKLSSLGATALDCSGTGGSGRKRFNTSTASAFVISAAKIPVAKFGNRAATSQSGSFDLLNQLGIPHQINAATAAHILNTAGLVFIFAPQAYPALAALSSVRATLGVPTVFNFIGPLLNPVSPTYRIMGVSHPIMKDLLSKIVPPQTLVIRSSCGLDELCPRCDETGAAVQRPYDNESTHRPTAPSSTSPDQCRSLDKNYTPSENAEIMLRIFRGDDTQSYEYELICQNSGAAIMVAGKARSLEDGISIARNLIASGEAQAQFEKVKSEYAKHS